MFSLTRRKRTPSVAKPSASHTRTFSHPGLGEITLLRSSRAQRLSLSVKPSGEVRLTMPLRLSESEGLAFLESKLDWVEQTRQRQALRHPKQVIELPYATRNHVLRLSPGAGTRCSIKLTESELIISYPAELSYTDPSVQSSIQSGIEQAWRVEAKSYLPTRVEELSRQFSLPCSTVTIRNTRTRWGSCSPSNTLSLSIHLMKLPDHLIDYILLHELCHTRHKNHGPHFHALLNQLTEGRHKAYHRELKSYTTRW